MLVRAELVGEDGLDLALERVRGRQAEAAQGGTG
jgi:hypothetical protein